MNAATKTAILDQIAQDSVPDTLDLWPEVRRLASRRRPSRTMQTRLVFAGVAATALVALVVGTSAQRWSGAETVNAATLLDRAEASAVSVSTYHLRMTRQAPSKSAEIVASELWYGGADRQRVLQQTRDARGATVETQEVVFDGAQTWIAETRGGQTSVIHTTGTEWTRPADDPSASASITDVLARYSQDKHCMSAQLAGEGTVAGHVVYQINVTPKPTACTIAVGDYRVGQVRQGTGDDASHTVARMQVSVDKQTFLPLKTEVRDGSGTVLDRSEVSFLEYDVALADATFSYTPPAGAQVSTFTGGSGADVKRALYERGTPPAPHK